jgi:hypothetical protein
MELLFTLEKKQKLFKIKRKQNKLKNQEWMFGLII